MNEGHLLNQRKIEAKQALDAASNRTDWPPRLGVDYSENILILILCAVRDGVIPVEEAVKCFKFQDMQR